MNRALGLAGVVVALVAALAGIVAIVYGILSARWIVAQPAGNARMQEIAAAIQQGANAYLTQQFKVVSLFFACIAMLLAFMAFGLHVQSKWVPFAFLTGGFFSAIAGWCRMKND